MVPAKDFKRRMVVEIDSAPHMIEQIQVQTPSARGSRHALQNQGTQSRRPKPAPRNLPGTNALNESSFERRPVQYMYRDPEALHFIDSKRSISFHCRSTNCATRFRS